MKKKQNVFGVIEDMNTLMFGFGKDVEDHIKKKKGKKDCPCQ